MAAGYINQVIARLQSEGKAQPTLTVRHLYNPNIEFSWHILPSLVAIITTIGCLIVTALSVAREREEGTFDQLLVSPSPRAGSWRARQCPAFWWRWARAP